MLNFSIGREDLYKPLEQVSGPAGINPNGDIITANVLLQVIKNSNKSNIKDAEYVLQMLCTDTEIEMISEIGLFCDNIQEGETTVNVKKLLEIVKSLPDGSYINFTLDDNEGKNLVISTNKNKFFLSTLPADKFPKIDVLNTIFSLKISSQELLTLMKTTVFSIAVESYRYFLNGMRFSLDSNLPKTLNIFTADGHRLSMQKGELLEDCIIPDSYEEDGFIFPKKGVSEVIKLLSIDKDNEEKVVVLSISKNSLKTQIDGITLISKLIAAKYPNVLSVIPTNCHRFIIINKDSFKSTLQRVSILCNSKNPAIEMTMSNNVMTIKAKNSQHEEASEVVDMISYEGDDFEIAFNAKYFIDICNAISTSKIKISMSESSNNAMIEPLPSEDEEISYARYIVSRVVI